MKPMLACDWKAELIRFPVIAQPKIDGVRALNLGGTLTGRSLKTFGNRHVTEMFSGSWFVGFDGEMACGDTKQSDLCRATTSALSSHDGQPEVTWWLFDYITDKTASLPYNVRLSRLRYAVELAQKHMEWRFEMGMPHAKLAVIPSYLIESMDELLDFDAHNLAAGYEGTILRDPAGGYKQGRSTAREGGLLRIKQFIDAEAVVVSLAEGNHNGNEATVGLLGQTERSSHQENMIPNGLVGSLECKAVADVLDGNRVVISAGQTITVSPGNMDHATRKLFWENQDMIVGKTIKFKFFPKGIKDKPRFPTYIGIRDAADMDK